MTTLEKILNEIKASSVYAETKDGYGASCVPIGAVERIIHKHMDNDGWISVEERPPEEPGRYNVTFRSDGSVHEIGYGSCRADVLGFPIGYGWYDLYSATYFSDDAILAWRPLPESYRKDRGK